MASLHLEKLRKEFGSGNSTVVAVDDISVSVEDGELLVLLGPSGCGKTTTLRMVAGLDQGTSGRIRIGDQVVCDPEQRIDVSPNRRDLGMVFQSFALWPHMTVRRNIGYPLRARRMRDELRSGWVDDVANLVDCSALLDRYPSQLSGGQQQRIALARALVARPQLLLFDEPLSNLDARLRDQLRHEIHQLHRRIGFTGLYVTHDQAEALAIGDRLAIMRSGRIEQLGTPREIFENPATDYVASFIGVGNCVALNKQSGRWQSAAGELTGAVPTIAGDRASLRVRSDAIRLGSPTALAAGEIAIQGGTIKDVTYGGPSLDVIVEFSDGGTVDARVSHVADVRYDVGSSTAVIFHRSDALFFDPDEGTPLSVTPPIASVTAATAAAPAP